MCAQQKHGAKRQVQRRCPPLRPEQQDIASSAACQGMGLECNIFCRLVYPTIIPLANLIAKITDIKGYEALLNSIGKLSISGRNNQPYKHTQNPIPSSIPFLIIRQKLRQPNIRQRMLQHAEDGAEGTCANVRPVLRCLHDVP